MPILAILLNLLSKAPAVLGPVTSAITGIPFGAIGNVLSNVWKNIAKNWRFYLPLLLIAIQLGTLYGWYHEHDSLLKEKAAHQQDINSYKAAQAAATDKAQSEKAILQKESKASADQADADYSTLYSQYRSVLLRYQAAQSRTGVPGDSQLPPAQSGNGPSASPQVPAGSISITLDDANVCAVNTARLQAVHDWALNPPKEP